MRGVEHIGGLYDAGCWIVERFGLKRWREWLVGGARGRTLEVGVGTGRNLPLYRDPRQVIAIDPDASLLRSARGRAPDVRLVAARVEALPFRDDAFDTVISSLVFCSVTDPAAGLAELQRVLRDDGELRMLEHVRARSRTLAWAQDRIQPLWTRAMGGCHPNRDTEGAIVRAGFQVIPGSRAERGALRRFVAIPRGGRPRTG
ncbi:MAG TPA: class I SAM-dependent methyltransferase [Longimicrobiales bacterium]|nr:class I SAM-dependent methyltransferase [Longimicrobiales bacterium]